MPIYEYLCEKGHTFDATQRMFDEPLTKCEVCGAPVRRVLQPVAVHFKGSGFYNTDYGTRKRQREKAAAESSKKSEAPSGSDGASGDGGAAKDGAGSSATSTNGATPDKSAGKSKASPAKGAK